MNKRELKMKQKVTIIPMQLCPIYYMLQQKLSKNPIIFSGTFMHKDMMV